MSIALLWFKRDLRITDHQPLYQAAKAHLAVLPIYIIEPDYWQQPDTSLRHWHFIAQALTELNQQLTALGQPLLVLRGPARQVIQALCQQYPIQAVYSHEETGNGWTYQRDIAVGAWLKQQGIRWWQYPQFAIKRRLADRDDWFAHADQWFKSAIWPTPCRLTTVQLANADFPSRLAALAPTRERDLAPCQQPALVSDLPEILQSFWHHRVRYYRQHIGTAALAAKHCSRLSPYISYGLVSLKQVQQHCLQLQRQSQDERSRQGLAAVFSRLRWHCHFMQKLEDEPRIEFFNMHRGYDGMREMDFNPGYFRAWQQGQTGYPLIDACMRSLIATGWLHFRGRAMLTAFASYQLWLHWRPLSLHLAQCFIDYEPGIHYPQMQMQAGTTGINPPRMYNPVLQSQQKDPQGHFIRRWCPELAPLPDEWLHQPWALPRSLQQRFGVHLDIDYPTPLVDHTHASRLARQKIQQWQHAKGKRVKSRRTAAASNNVAAQNVVLHFDEKHEVHGGVHHDAKGDAKGVATLVSMHPAQAELDFNMPLSVADAQKHQTLRSNFTVDSHAELTEVDVEQTLRAALAQSQDASLATALALLSPETSQAIHTDPWRAEQLAVIKRHASRKRPRQLFPKGARSSSRQPSAEGKMKGTAEGKVKSSAKRSAKATAKNSAQGARSSSAQRQQRQLSPQKPATTVAHFVAEHAIATSATVAASQADLFSHNVADEYNDMPPS